MKTTQRSSINRNVTGSSLVQGLLILGLFAAVVVGFLNLQLSDPNAVQTMKSHRHAKTAHTARAALAIGCDQYLKGMTLLRNQATLLDRLNREFPEATGLQVLATFPPSTPAGPLIENQTYSIVIATRVEDKEDPVLSRLNVAGRPTFADSGEPALQVLECTASPYDRECKRQIEIAEKSTALFEELGSVSYRTIGKCLKKYYEEYRLQTCIEPYTTAVSTFNLCAEFARQMDWPTKTGLPQTLTLSQIQDLHTYCAVQTAQAVNRIPMPGAQRVATCMLSGNPDCPEDLCL